MIIDLIFVEIGNLLHIKCVIITYRKAHINLVQSVGFFRSCISGILSERLYSWCLLSHSSCLIKTRTDV